MRNADLSYPYEDLAALKLAPLALADLKLTR